jgi:hypothetical protein
MPKDKREELADASRLNRIKVIREVWRGLPLHVQPIAEDGILDPIASNYRTVLDGLAVVLDT